MKKVFFFSLAIMSTAILNVFGSWLLTYQQLRSEISRGNQFEILLDLQHCTGRPGLPMGYFTPCTMELIPATNGSPECVETSVYHDYDYVRYTFYSDNSVVVKSTRYDQKDLKLVGRPHTFTCSMDNGVYVKPSKWNARRY